MIFQIADSKDQKNEGDSSSAENEMIWINLFIIPLGVGLCHINMKTKKVYGYAFKQPAPDCESFWFISI